MVKILFDFLKKLWNASPNGIVQAVRHRLAPSRSASNEISHQIVPPYDPDGDEIQRLKSIPRYIPTTTVFMDKELNLVDADSYLSMYEEIFEKRNYEFEASRKDPLIIDCGANIGVSIIFFKTMYPASRIIAFEPDKNVFAALKKNVESFGFVDIELHNKAVWNAESEISFYSEGSWGGRIPKPGDEENIVKINTVRLKDFLDQKVDFLKIDVEGAETEILKDCAESLTMVDYLFVEYHSHSKEQQTLHDILSIIQDAGFRYHVKEASCRKLPFIEKSIPGMDLQLDIFGFRL